MMDFGSFLSHVEAMFKANVHLEDFTFGKTHVFNLGTDEKVEEGIREVWDDLKDDMKDGVPMPFRDMSCVSQVPNRKLPGNPLMWIFDRTIELELRDRDREDLKDAYVPEGASDALKEAAKRGPIQKILVMRVEEQSPVVVSWICYFYGVHEKSIMLVAIPTEWMGVAYGKAAEDPKFMAWCMEESRPVVKQIAAISHPGNYIVQVKPKLTPKEARRVASGKTFPTQKMPHFVVVDHDVLVGMSGRGAGGSHASPVPHHRRGHWMRLAERCREARALGKDRVWVRPTYVGDAQFADLKNDYAVMMDFGKKELASV